jgi:hypothetical protein
MSALSALVLAVQEQKAALQRKRNLAHAAFLQHQIEIKQRKQGMDICCTNRAGRLYGALAIPSQLQP